MKRPCGSTECCAEHTWLSVHFKPMLSRSYFVWPSYPVGYSIFKCKAFRGEDPPRGQTRRFTKGQDAIADVFPLTLY